MRYNEPLDKLQFTLTESEKQGFKRACRLNDVTMAQCLRKYIKNYIRTHYDDQVRGTYPDLPPLPYEE